MNTVVELAVFSRLVKGRLSEVELFEFVTFIAANPSAGELVEGAGGARKIRWAASGRGKSGGARIITYFHCDRCPVFLLGVYLKSERANLTQAEVNTYKAICKELSHEHDE